MNVEPGAEAVLGVTVRNTGEIVDEFTLQIVGHASAWTDVTPPSLRLFPGDEGDAQLRFRPPRMPSTPAGPIPFGISVRPREDPAAGVVEEGIVDVAPFADAFAELVPHTSTGRRHARHEVTLHNRGNVRIRAVLGASDPDGLLTFRLSAGELRPPPGTAEVARVAVRARRQFLWGPPRTVPFSVLMETLPVSGNAGEGETISVEGGMIQQPIIPRWMPRTLAALAGLLLALVMLWALLVKPTVEAAAEDKAKQTVAQQPTAPNEGSSAEPKPEPAPVPNPPGGGNGGGGTRKRTARRPVVSPIDGRLEIGGDPTLRVGGKTTVSLTDVIFENTRASTGIVQLRRDEQVLLSLGLENFRYLDYHFVSPIVLRADQRFTLTCRRGNCDGAALYYSGSRSTRR